MYYYLVAPSEIVLPTATGFTYHSDKPLAVGTLVRISIGKKLVNGIIIENTKKPTFPTKPIDAIIAPRPLPLPLLELSTWMSKYYVAHLGLVLNAILPAGLHKKRRYITIPKMNVHRKRTKIVLNKTQSNALTVMDRYSSGTLLLHGVTGSGKTQMYIETAKHQIRQGKSVIILVPEIALTPQLLAEFANHFDNVIATHSGMTESERHTTWLNVLQSDSPQIIIGPRSTLFMPVANLGLIVVDECHEPSYKQDQTPRYSALRAASVLARNHAQAKVVLGSATPPVSDYYLAKTTKKPIIRLSEKAVATIPPTIHLVDIKKRGLFREHRLISDQLLLAVREALADNKQILLFHNRRGTAPTTLCVSCSWSALCPACQVPLTLHADVHNMLCHLCGVRQSVPPDCPTCGSPDVTFKGFGTKLIEDQMHTLFPKAIIARFDADNDASQTLQARYQQLYEGDIDIIIGTQLLAKGLDLPNLRVVGVMQADSGLHLPDYQARERVFQLLYQVAGRVGRGNHHSKVVVQTFAPDDPVITHALQHNYSGFYEQELRARQNSLFPPFTHLLKLTCSYKTELGAVRAAQRLARDLNHAYPRLTILGPTPSFYERLGGKYRWQLLIKSKKRDELAEIALRTPQSWQSDLDPASLL